MNITLYNGFRYYCHRVNDIKPGYVWTLDKSYPLDELVETANMFNFAQKNYPTEYHKFRGSMISIDPLWETLLKHAQITYYQKHHIEFLNETRVHKEARVKPFIPAGSYYKGSHISLNVSNMSTYCRYGQMWGKKTMQHIFTHELGHAINYTSVDRVEDMHLIRTPEKVIHYDEYSKQPHFTRLVKQCFCRYCHMPKKDKRKSGIDYYVKPTMAKNYPAVEKKDSAGVSDLQSDIGFGVPDLKKSNFMNSYQVKPNYDRPNAESFSESFAYILDFMLCGYGIAEQAALHNKTSVTRRQIKVLMPVIRYLLKNIKWDLIGVPSHRIVKRKIQFRRILDKIENIPYTKNQAPLHENRLKHLKRNRV